MRNTCWLTAVLMSVSSIVFAQQPDSAAQRPTPASQTADTDPVTFEEQVVVTASRVEQQLVNAPATVSVVSSQTIESSPATNIGDLLRAVPGVNVSQLSARDINLTSRGATSTLSTSQLALVDGRSVYLDFFGMVMWDLLPTNPGEIRQIEVIRGPASAVWGANAMTGVVNVITKTPRELAAEGGTTLTLGVGGFAGRSSGADDGGGIFYLNGSHAEAASDRWSYKVSAGYYAQDPLPRPTGLIPNGGTTPYPAFANTGTSQPKFDARVDYDLMEGGRVTIAGGVAGTEGIIHSGIGPFDVDSSSRLGYVTARYQKAGRRVSFFSNLLHGDAANLLSIGPDRRPIALAFDTQTFDFEASDVRPIGTRHVVSFGGNFRRNNFDISLAPAGEDRNEGGVYVQDEIFLNERIRWVVGGRVDKFSSIEGAVFSPRTTVLVKPAPDHTVRASFNRAFRAPSLINNHLNVTVVTPVVLPVVGLFAFPTNAVGNPNLEQETMTAFELGYTGIVARRATISAAVYWNATEGAIYFTPVAAFSASNPPPAWPLPPQFVPAGALTSRYTYLNIGKVKDKGVELGVDTAVNRYITMFVNYSHQWMPEVDELSSGATIRDINWPAEHRFNAGMGFSRARFLGNASVSHTGEAYWQDVLDLRFAGTTEAFTTLNAGFGVRWLGEKLVTSVKVTNLTNADVLQHVFGDIMKRQFVGEMRLTF